MKIQFLLKSENSYLISCAIVFTLNLIKSTVYTQKKVDLYIRFNQSGVHKLYTLFITNQEHYNTTNTFRKLFNTAQLYYFGDRLKPECSLY